MRELLSEFSEMGARHNFLMNSGRECEGWVVAVEDDHILFVDADAQGNKDEIKILFRAIDMSSLAYRDDEKRCWMGARWDETKAGWEHALLSRDPDPEEMKKEAERHSKLGKIKQILKPPAPARQMSPVNPPSSLTSQFTRMT